MKTNRIDCVYDSYASDTSWDYLEFKVKFINNTGNYVDTITTVDIYVYVDDVVQASGNFRNLKVDLKNGEAILWTLRFGESSYNKDFWPYLDGRHSVTVEAEYKYI